MSKCRHLKQFTSKGTLRPCVFLSKVPFLILPHTLPPPLTHCIGVYCIVYNTYQSSHREGGSGGELTKEWVIGATVLKAGSKIQT